MALLVENKKKTITLKANDVSKQGSFFYIINVHTGPRENKATAGGAIRFKDMTDSRHLPATSSPPNCSLSKHTDPSQHLGSIAF